MKMRNKDILRYGLAGGKSTVVSSFTPAGRKLSY
jgi:hypothetical protein